MPIQQQASADLLALVAVVVLKHLPNVLNDLGRSQGKPPGERPTMVPERLLQIVNVKRLFSRFAQGHYLADDEEKAKLTSLCDWLTDTAGVLSRNPNPKHADWAPEQFVGKTPLPADAFAQLVEQVKAGRIG